MLLLLLQDDRDAPSNKEVAAVDIASVSETTACCFVNFVVDVDEGSLSMAIESLYSCKSSSIVITLLFFFFSNYSKAILINAGGSVRKRLRFVLAFGNDIKHGPTEAPMTLIENGANVGFPNAKVSSLSLVKKFAATFLCVSTLICMHCNCVI